MPHTPHDILSPDVETFSTPPTTPGPATVALNGTRQTLSRKTSRPTSLHIDRKQSDWTPDIQVLAQSPDPNGDTTGAPMPPPISDDPTIAPPHHPISLDMPQHHKPVNSPCFVHSQLDKGALLADWLRNKQQHPPDNLDLGVAKSLQHANPRTPSTVSTHPSGLTSDYDSHDEEYTGNVTKKLAETAVGVREMSKQLGRARVQSNIQNVLIITKARDNRLIKLTRELAVYLMLKKRRGAKRGLVVYVDSQLRNSKRFDAEGICWDHPELFVPFPRRRTSSNHSVSSASSHSTTAEETDEGQLRYWTSSMCSQSPHLFDFVVTLGGDGTVLFTSWLFQRVVPPVLSFALGSLGFLTNFDFADHQAVMDSAIDNGIRVNLRMRFTCTVYRAVVNETKKRKAVKKGETGEIIMKNIEKGGGWEALEGGWTGHTGNDGKCGAKDKEIMCFTTRAAETFEVLNDLVVDRGPSPYVSLLELFGDEHHMTTVQADGLTISTPTGSTAYSLSAGGSLVHPEIPAILITPICPHTLSFRPMLLPDSMELRICVPYNSRSTAWASFDGRGRVELKQGDHIKVTASMYPFPTVCADKQSTDWFHAISRTLKWNERERQKSFVVVEEGPSSETKPKKRGKRLTSTGDPLKPRSEDDPLDQDDEEDEESSSESEEDTFDIDDSSVETDSSPPTAKSTTSEQDQLGEMLPKTPNLRRRTKSRSRSRSRPGRASGLDSPSRFATPFQQQHSAGARRVEFQAPRSPPYTAESSPESSQFPSNPDAAPVDNQQYLAPKHTPRGTHRTLSPRGRDLELESVRTPTLTSLIHNRSAGARSRTRAGGDQESRAFAVWGQDESSDSAASDTDS